jgi:hypothetical protein
VKSVFVEPYEAILTAHLGKSIMWRYRQMWRILRDKIANTSMKEKAHMRTTEYLSHLFLCEYEA